MSHFWCTVRHFRYQTWLEAPIVILIVVLATALRAENLAQPPAWYDEHSSLEVATGQTLIWPFDLATAQVKDLQLPYKPDLPNTSGFTPSDIWKKNKVANVIRATGQLEGGSGITYELALHVWANVIGLEDENLRSLSLIFGLLTVATIYIGLRVVGGTILDAALSAGIAALHPMLIWTSRQIRPYSMAILFCAIATFLLIRLVQRRALGMPTDSLAMSYGCCAATAILTHYLCCCIFVGHVIWSLLVVRSRRTWYRLIGAGSLGLLIVGFWLSTGGSDGLKVMQLHDALWLDRALSGKIAAFNWGGPELKFFATYVLPQGLGVQPVDFYSSVFGSLRWSALLTAFASIGIISYLMTRKGPTGVWSILLLALILSLSAPIMQILVAWRHGHVVSFTMRYTTFSAPFVAIMLGLATSLLFKREYWQFGAHVVSLPAQLLLVAMTTFFLWAPHPPLSETPRASAVNQYRAAAAKIHEIARQDDTVVYRDPFEAVLISLYLKDMPDLRSQISGSARVGSAVSIERKGTVVEIAKTLPDSQRSCKAIFGWSKSSKATTLATRKTKWNS